MCQVKIILLFHHMIGALVTDRISKPIRSAIRTNDVKADDFGLLAMVRGEIRNQKCGIRPHDRGPVPFVKPLRLHADFSRRGFPAFYAPFEQPHRIRHASFVMLLLDFRMHVAPRRGTADVGQTRP